MRVQVKGLEYLLEANCFVGSRLEEALQLWRKLLLRHPFTAFFSFSHSLGY